MSQGYSLNPFAQEFSVPSHNPSWNLGASDFVPFTPGPPILKEEEVKESPKEKVFLYSFSFLFSLRDLYKSLPPGVVVPELYSKNRVASTKSKKKHGPIKEHAKDQSFKRAESIFVSSSILVKTERPFTEKLKKTPDELEKKSREIRCILNKLSAGNFDKLCKTLVTDFTYGPELLKNLANFLFERATALNFPELYSQMCRRLRSEFKPLQLSTPFRKAIVEKCQESFYREDGPLVGDKLMETEFKRRRRLIGNIKFIGLLHKESMIKSDIMYECFEVLLDPKSLSEETLETSISLFKDTCPMLVGNNFEKINEYFDRIVAFRNDTLFSTRIHFMIQDLIEMKEKIMVPRKNYVKSPVKASPIRQNAPVAKEDPDESKIHDDFKDKLKVIIKSYVAGNPEDEWMPDLTALIQSNFKFHLEIIVQLLKYGLYEYYKEDQIIIPCRLASLIIKDYNLDQETIQKAITLIEADMDEIRTDSPQSEKMLIHMRNFFNLV